MPKNPPGDRLAVAAAVALTHLGAAYTGARWHAASCTPSVPTRWPPPPPPRACSAPTGPTWPPAWTPSSTPPPARAQPPAERIRSNGWTYRFSPIGRAFRQEENASPRGPEDQRTARVSSGPLVLRVRPIRLPECTINHQKWYHPGLFTSTNLCEVRLCTCIEGAVQVGSRVFRVRAPYPHVIRGQCRFSKFPTPRVLR